MADETFTYGDLSEIHKAVQNDPFFHGKSIEEFSTLMNEATQSHAYDQGLNNNLVKRATRAIDTFIKPISTPLGDLTGDITKGVGLPQFEAQGRAIGEVLPRMLVEGGLIAGGLAAGGPAGLAAAATGATGMGASTYAETGSPLAGGISALSGLAFPAASKAGEWAVRPLIKNAFYSDIAGTVVPKVALNSVARYVEPAIEATGRNVGIAVNNEISTQLISKTTTGQFENPLTPEGMFQRIGSQLPFAIIDAANIARGPAPEAGQPGRGEFRSQAEYVFARNAADIEHANATKQAQDVAETLAAKDAMDQTAQKPIIPVEAVVPETVATSTPMVDMFDLHMFDMLVKAHKNIRETGSFNPNEIPMEFRVKVSKQLIELGIIDETGKALVQPGLTDNQVIDDIKKRTTQFELPNTEEELQHIIDLAPGDTKLSQLAQTKLKGMMEQSEMVDFIPTDPIDQLRKQLIERNGPAVDKVLVDVPIEQKLKQVQQLSEFLDDIMHEAVVRRVPGTNALINDAEGLTEFNAGTPKPFVSSKSGLIKNYVNDLLGMGEKPTVIMERQYNAYVEQIAHNLKLLDLKKAELNAVGFDSGERKAEQARMARLNELSEAEQGVVASVLQSKLWFEGTKGFSHVEHDITSTILSAAVAYHDKVTDAVDLLAKYKNATKDMTPETADLVVMRNYINKAAINRLNRLRKDLREKSESQTQEGPDQRSAIDIYNEYEVKLLELQNQSREQQARLDKIESTVKSLPDTDAVGWRYELYVDRLTGEKSTPRPVDFERNIDEQVARLNKALNLVRRGELGYRVIDSRGHEDIYATVPWEQISKELGYSTGLDPNLRLWLRKEFIPKLRGRLYREMEPKARLSGDQTDVLANANVQPHILDESTNPLASMLGTEDWFRTWMTTRGMNKAQIETFTPLAMKVAASFQDVGYTRIGTMLTEGISGLSFKPLVGLRNASIWLNKDIGDAPAEVQVYLKLRTLGHELWHTMVNARLKGVFKDDKGQDLPVVTQIDNALKWAVGLTEADRAEINGRYADILVPKELRGGTELENYDKFGMQYAAKDAHEFLADYVGQMVLGHVSPDRAALMRPFDAELMFDGPEIQHFAKGVYVPIFEMTKMFEQYFNESGRTDVGTVMTKIADSIKESLNSLKQVDNAVSTLNLLASHDLTGYIDMLKRDANAGAASYETLKEVYNNVLPDDIKARLGSNLFEEAKNAIGIGATSKAWAKQNGVQPGWLARTLIPSAQLSAMFPQLQPVFDLVRAYRAEGHLFSLKIASDFMTGKVKGGATKVDMEGSGLATLYHSPRARALSDEVSLAKGTLDRVLTDSEITAMAKGASQKEIEAVINFHRATESSMVRAMNRMLVSDEMHITDVGALHLMAIGINVKPNAVLGLTQTLVKAIKQSASLDPYIQQQGQITLMGLQSVKGVPETINLLTSGLTKLVEKAKALSNKPQYMPEFRSGQYQVVWKEGTKPGRAAFETQEEALAYKQKLLDRGVKQVNIWDKYDEKAKSYGVNPIMVMHEAAIQKAMYDAALKSLSVNHPQFAVIAKLINYDPATVALHEFADRGMNAFNQKRKPGTLGRESIDFTTNVIDYIQRLGQSLARRNVKDKVALALQDTDLTANPKLLKLAQDHFDNVVNPTGKEWTLLKQLNFTYFMGFAPATMLIEGSQSLLTLIPQLTRDTGSIAKSYAIWGHGVKTAVEMVLNNGQFKDPVLGAAVERAVAEKRIDYGTQQEFHTNEENLMPNLGNLLKGSQGGITISDMVKKPLFWYLNGARWLYGRATKANSLTAFVAAFEHARKTMTPEQAYNYADRTVALTMFGGGASARPVGMFSLLQGSKASGAMGVFYSLGSYTFSTIAMMARLGKEGILRSGNIPVADKNAALKAFGQMMVTQVALGGALALPGATAAMALLEQIFPNLMVKQTVTDLIQDLFKTDDEWGGMLADTAMKGAPSRFLNVDLSSRIALSNVLGVSGYDGFSIMNAIGPTGSMFNALATGANQMLEGDFAGGAKNLVPVAYKNIIDLYNNQGAVRNKAGNLIYDPTTMEKALYALGLRPTTITNFRDAQKNIARMEAIKTRENANFFGELAQRLQQGDVMGVRQQLQYRQMQDPMFDSVAGGRRVVEEVEKRVFPIDLARTGSKGGASERQRIQGTLQDRGLPTEMQRLQFKLQLGQQLGLPQTQSKLQMNMAQMTDHIMMMNSALSRQEATMMVERLFGFSQKML